MSSDNQDGIPGDYSSIEGFKERAAALGNPGLARYIERAEERTYYDEEIGGYRIRAPDPEDVDDMEMLFHFGVLTGAALEREYPGPDQDT